MSTTAVSYRFGATLSVDDDVCSISSSRAGRRKTCGVSWNSSDFYKNGRNRTGSSGSGSTTSTTFRASRSRAGKISKTKSVTTPTRQNRFPHGSQNKLYSSVSFPSVTMNSETSEDIAKRKKKARDRWKNVGYCMIMVSSAASEFQKLEMTRKKLEVSQNKIKTCLGQKDEEEYRHMFDPSFFKRPKNEIYFSREIEDVARNRRRERTKAHIRSLRLVLRECAAFAAYPDYAQVEMTRLGILEGYGGGRVILREGHRPEKVYFILSGTVVLTKCDKDLGKDITIQIMNKGEIFGDTEVLEDGCRPATVTTCLEVMFWSVDAEDFKNSMTKNEEEYRNSIYDRGMSSESSLNRTRSVQSRKTRFDTLKSENGEETPTPQGREMIDPLTAVCARSAVYPFLSSLTWFEDVPTIKFLEDPKAATLVYYRNNKCIVQSSKKNDVLYFVRKGKCDVIAKITIQTKIAPTTITRSRSKSRRNTPAAGKKTPGSPPKKKSAAQSAALPPDTPESNQEAAVSAIDRFMLIRQETQTFPLINMTDAQSGESDTSPKKDAEKSETPVVGKRAAMFQRRASLACILEQQRALSSGETEEEEEEEVKPVGTQGEMRGSARTVDTSRSSVHTKKEFLKVCTLQEGDVFGMTSLFSMDSELDTSLVSRGCECVIVNKTTFTRLLDRDSKDVLREKVLFYPTYAEMKKKLLNAYSWNIYKDNLREDSNRYQER